jgi:ligand-binding sensor domain-containing protein
MKRNLVPLFCFLIFLSYSSFSQEYSYTNYDVKDGLAGSNVYCITQDKQGLLWMGTEAGVSRFDGTHFKNFTLEDGLSDIEVLQIFADSRDRVWMGPFSKSICYYYKGSIHNQENDSLLKQVQLPGKIDGFAEDKDGNILVGTREAIYLLTSGGQVQRYDTIEGQQLICSAVATGKDGHFLVTDKSSIYRLSDGKFTLLLSLQMSPDWIDRRSRIYNPVYIGLNAGIVAWKDSFSTIKGESLITGKTIKYSFERRMVHVSLSVIGDSLVYHNETQGTREYNIFTGASRYFKLDANTSRTFRDDEGNTWFTSIGRGVFRLNSDEFKNIRLSLPSYAHCTVKSIRKMDNYLAVGANYTSLFRFSLPALQDAGSYKLDSSETDELQFITKIKDGRLFVATSNRIFTCFFGHDPLSRQVTYSVKSAVLKNDSEVIVGGAYGVHTMNMETLQFKDTLFKERATVVNYIDGAVYIGTLNGLYVINKDRRMDYWGKKDPALRKRISAIQPSSDGTVWIATYGEGILGYKDGRRVGAFTRKQGLSSDLCRDLRLHDNIIWAGTDRGLNKIDLENQDDPITIYTANDGLGSDIVNTLFTDSSMVYVGTSAGLSFFNANHVDKSAGCRLVLLGLINSTKDRLSDSASLSLPYTDNNIRFEFAGISYKSSGNIWYRYRLLGLDSAWKRTKESFLEYPTLPSGEYEFELQAINKFGILSRKISLPFTVTTPFWRSLWFYGASLVLFLSFTWLFVSLRIKHLRRRQAEREELRKRLAETEHMALQAQMNPHFIFNCLNSIQQYIFDQDILAANKYITGFAKLIRATLNNSTKQFISLTEEIDYLSVYLSLEKLRFKDKMSYVINIEPSLRKDTEEIVIPPMLIQPYVENSMRHGLRHKKNGNGYIHIHIRQEGEKLTIVIDDNGIGREQAARYKTREHIEYQSRGMSLTADRIRLINTINGDGIKVEVIDLTGPEGESTGTRVIVRFPRYDLFLKKSVYD